jgi:transposase
MKEKGNRPNYTQEFKQDAVKLVIEQQYSCSEVGRRLGIPASNVTRWVRQYHEDQQALSDGGVTRRDLEAENRRLKKENKRLDMEREILKKPRPSLRRSRVEIRLYPARKEGLSRHIAVQGDGSQPERIL